MNYSILLFGLNLPAHPIVLDVQALAVRFQTVTDHRTARGKRYPLVAILTIAVLAKLTGANQVRNVAEWAKQRQRELCALFRLTHPTMPHPATLRWSAGTLVMNTVQAHNARRRFRPTFLARDCPLANSA